MSENQQYTPVYLEPFIHQVGGHSHMFSLDEYTVCKPLIERELTFYRTMPSQMRPFAPQFRGVVKAKIVEESDGFVAVMALVPKSYPIDSSTSSSPSPAADRRSNSDQLHCGKRKIRLRRSGRIEIVDNQRAAVFEEVDCSSDLSHCASSLEHHQQQQQKHTQPVSHNPWLLHCSSTLSSAANPSSHTHRGYSVDGSGSCRASDPPPPLTPSPSALSPSAPATQHPFLLSAPTEYLLLENLTHSYQRPCVLDLKMGTRQYADDDTAAKQKRKKAKVASSTSSSLGVRINGMQVYDVSLGRYLCRSKYHGRQLTVAGFKLCLRQFLAGACSRRRRVYIVEQLLQRLQQLHSVLLQLPTFRFFTSSLLLLYDATTERHRLLSPPLSPATSTAAVDFSGGGTTDADAGDSSLPSSLFSPTSSAPHTTTVSSSTAAAATASASSCVGGGGGGGGIIESDDCDSCATSISTASADCSPGRRCRRSAGGPPAALPLSTVPVDVRVIDFAHATHDRLDEAAAAAAVHHTGPDCGFLFGVQSLLKELRLVLHELSDGV